MQSPVTTTRASRKGLGRPELLLVSIVAFALATILSRVAAVAFLAVGVGCALLSIFTVGETDQGSARDRRIRLLIVGSTAIFALISPLGPAHGMIGNPPNWLYPAAATSWIVLGVAWMLVSQSGSGRLTIYLAVLIASCAYSVVILDSAAGVGFDVFFLHEAAADAIAIGDSPYGEAVTVENGAPEGDEFIVGYPYAPVTALAYSLGSWLGGDARWTSLLCWVAVLALIGAPSLGKSGRRLPLGVMVVFAAIPTWPLVLTTGWTESFSLVWIAAAALLFAQPAAFGALSGIFFGSKQYLLAGSPLIAFNRLPFRWPRFLWSLTLAAVGLLPLIWWGLDGFFDAAIGFHLNTSPRTDSSSIVGLLAATGVQWAPSFWLMAVAVVAMVVWLKGHVENLATWLAALAAVLSTALFLSSQAFPNYWFLVAGLCALGVVATDGQEAVTQP